MTIGPHLERASARCRHSRILICISATLTFSIANVHAQTSPGAREVPAKVIPVPDTVSSQMQKLIAAPLRPTWNAIPKTVGEWKAQVTASANATVARLKPMAEALRVKVTPITVDRVKAFEVKPEEIALNDEGRFLVHIHGGCFMIFPASPGLARQS